MININAFNKFYIEGFFYENGVAEQRNSFKIEVDKNNFIDFLLHSEYASDIEASFTKDMNIIFNFLSMKELQVFVCKWFKYDRENCKNSKIEIFKNIHEQILEGMSQGVNETYIFATT